jgi:arylsulfatase A-like enzyme
VTHVLLRGVGLALALAVSGASAQERPARPNIILIQTDDQAAWALGISGNRDAHTPNLDRLAREGAYLRNAFVNTPVCSPSRASLLTSRYGSELGITDWINPRTEPEIGLDPQTATWPALLARAGYVNAIIGKWHLGTEARFDPSRFGFQHFMGFREGSAQPLNPTLEVAGQKQQMTGFTVDLVTEDALQFIRSQRARAFAVLLNYREPHARYVPVRDEDWAHYEKLDPAVPQPAHPDLDVPRVKQLMREYLASVASIDRNVGRVLALLDELELRDNTVVIFTSDHGYNIGHHGVLHKGNARYITLSAAGIVGEDPRVQRPNAFDTSLRTPTIVRWPARIRAGTTVERTITNLDWFPTILAMAGVAVPTGITVRGRNALPLLQGRRIAWNDDLYVEWSQHHYVKTHIRAYRTPQWKLVRDFLNRGKDELYHLAADPGEARNLIDDPSARAIKRQLDARLVRKLREMNDPVLRTLR